MELEYELKDLEIIDLISKAKDHIKRKDLDAYKDCQKEFIYRLENNIVELNQKEIDLAWKLNNYIQDNFIFVPLLNHENMMQSKEERDRDNLMYKIYNEIVSTHSTHHKEITFNEKLKDKNYSIKLIIDVK